MSPREAEAVAVAADALEGVGDPGELVVALVEELARRGLVRDGRSHLRALIAAQHEPSAVVRVEAQTALGDAS